MSLHEVYDQARTIFCDYCGSRFHMDRDGAYAEYSSYEISAEQEYQWAEELAGELLASAESKSLEELYRLETLASSSKHTAGPILNELANIAERKAHSGSPWTILRYAETILNLMGIVREDYEDSKILSRSRLVLLHLVSCIAPSDGLIHGGDSPDYPTLDANQRADQLPLPEKHVSSAEPEWPDPPNQSLSAGHDEPAHSIQTGLNQAATPAMIINRALQVRIRLEEWFPGDK